MVLLDDLLVQETEGHLRSDFVSDVRFGLSPGVDIVLADVDVTASAGQVGERFLTCEHGRHDVGVV